MAVAAMYFDNNLVLEAVGLVLKKRLVKLPFSLSKDKLRIVLMLRRSFDIVQCEKYILAFKHFTSKKHEKFYLNE